MQLVVSGYNYRHPLVSTASAWKWDRLITDLFDCFTLYTMHKMGKFGEH